MGRKGARARQGRKGWTIAPGLAAAFASVTFVFRTPSAQEYKPNLPADHPAIQYATAHVTDPAARLSNEFERDAPIDGSHGLRGVLSAVLERLKIPADSQMLVFSKTSAQAARVSPEHPRAIYFNDDVAVAYVPGAPAMEIAAVDPAIGPIFYTLSVDSGGKPSVVRSVSCLRCHQGPNTAGVPGLYVGSVIPGPTGAPLHDMSAIITDHRTPFRDRWGGWYVTSKHGEQPDRANAVASNPADPGELVRESRANLTSLAGRFDRSAYLAPTSDIVALMTFEHQTQFTNLLARVAWQARMLGQPADAPAAAFALNSDIDDLVAYMLFAGEAPLKEPVEGVSGFAKTFEQSGPRDRRGRSLREFDLKTRLFRYPLSYMVYSAGFDALPGSVKERIYRRLHEFLIGADKTAASAHLSAGDRTAIREILRDTKKDLPDDWR
jgi:hypothetical protein